MISKCIPKNDDGFLKAVKKFGDDIFGLGKCTKSLFCGREIGVLSASPC